MRIDARNYSSIRRALDMYAVHAIQLDTHLRVLAQAVVEDPNASADSKALAQDYVADAERLRLLRLTYDSTAPNGPTRGMRVSPSVNNPAERGGGD